MAHPPSQDYGTINMNQVLLEDTANKRYMGLFSGITMASNSY
jgi:hypothetical protein